MTFIVGLIILACLGIGILVIFGAVFARPSRLGQKVCGQCRNANPRHAKFCAHCGRRLGS